MAKRKSKTKTRTPTKGGATPRAARKAKAPPARRARQAPAGGAATRGAAAVRLPRDPKGRRAQFYQDPAIDQLWAVVTALTGEVSVAFDRLDTVERVLDRHGHVTRDAIESYRPDDAAAAERARRREELIQRVFQVLSQYGR